MARNTGAFNEIEEEEEEEDESSAAGVDSTCKERIPI